MAYSASVSTGFVRKVRRCDGFIVLYWPDIYWPAPYLQKLFYYPIVYLAAILATCTTFVLIY